VAGADQWMEYEEPRTGMSIQYPSGIFTQSVATEDGHQFFGPDAELEISARDGIGVGSTEELRDLMINSKDYSRLTYSPGGQSWMVASGYRGENIYYEKFFVRNGEVRAFSVQYPKAMRSVYDPIVERLEDTFDPW
jgi:hypothetical protein